MKDIKNCVVGVLVDGELRGTGYVATDNLVITCAHVLTDDALPPGEGISVRFHCNGEEVPVDVSADRWSPSDKEDIAALELRLEPDESLPAGVEVATLGRSEGRKDRECQLLGYPDLAEIDGLGGRAKVIEYVREESGCQLIQLKSDEVTNGYSGSPVFDAESDEVIGTVVQTVGKIAFATPMEVIAECISGLPIDSEQNLDAHREARDRARNGILNILTDHPEATNSLAKQLETEDHRPEDIPEHVADTLLDLSLADFLPLVVDGFTTHIKRDPAVANAFRDLATYVLPQIYREDFLREIRRRLTSGDNFLVIPASHKSVIELLIAGAMGHKLTFDDTWRFDGDIPRGSHEIQPSAELGIIKGDTLQKFIEGFERAIMVKIGGLPAGMPDPTRAINRKLARLKDGEPPIRYYYVYRDGQSRVEELESRYPDVVFISHELTGHDDDEFDILDCLKDMFCPKGDQ